MIVEEAVRVVKAPLPAVVEPMDPGAAKVAPPRELAFKLATFVVLETTKGAVPVATVLVNCPDTLREVPVAAPITGVTSVGDVARTTEPEPVEVVDPVPPLATGKAVPE